MSHGLPEKVRRELTVTAIFAARMGCSADQILVEGGHVDGKRPDGVLSIDGSRKVLELTMADPEGSGAVPEERRSDSIVNGGIRSAHHRLRKEFHALPSKDRPFEVNIRFRESMIGSATAIELPRNHQVALFVQELVSLLALASSSEFEILHQRKSRRSMIIRDLSQFSLLHRFARAIELTEPPAGHPGLFSSNLDALWSIDADLQAVISAKQAKPIRGDWLIIYEWDVPGALPDDDELPALEGCGFERIFLLNPSSPVRLVEWNSCERRWRVPDEALRGTRLDDKAILGDLVSRWRDLLS